MRRTDSLFQLIKAMNRADKRNFKLLTQLTAGDKKYLKVFDAIDKQAEYDEAKLLKQFEGDSIVNQFSVAKNYLYNSILKSLAYFYKGENSELSSLNLQVRILVEKNLLPHAQKILRKARMKAESQEDFHTLMELLQTEREILLGLQNYKRFDVDIRDIQEKEAWAQERIDNLLAYQHLTDRMFQIITASQSARQGRDMRDIGEILANPLMQSEATALSSKARILYFNIRRNHAHYVGAYREMADFAQKIVDTFDKRSELKDAWVHYYIRALYNLSHSQYVINDNLASRKTLKHMKDIKTRSERARIGIFEYYYVMSLGHAHNAGEVGEGRQLLNSLKSELPRFLGKLSKPSELLLYYLSAKMCLIAGDFQEGVEWIQRFLNEPRTEVRRDLQCFARLLHLILHFEQGNYKLILQELKPTYRFIFKRDRMYGVERLVLRSLRRLAEVEPGSEQKRVFRELRAGLKELAENRYEGPAMRLLSIDSWVDSKLDGLSFAEVRQLYFSESLKKSHSST